MTWILVGAASLVTVLGAAVLVVLLRAVGNEIPRVSAIEAALGTNGRVEFSWPDPGISASDRYQLTVTEDGVPSQPALQSAPLFVIDAEPGDTICLTVAVNRDGMTGESSAPKCVDAVEG